MERGRLLRLKQESDGMGKATILGLEGSPTPNLLEIIYGLPYIPEETRGRFHFRAIRNQSRALLRLLRG